MAKKPASTANDWASIIAKTMSKETDEVPEGFQTVETIAQLTGRSETMTRVFLRKAVASGLVEDRKFVIRAGERLYPVRHFRQIRP